jgi:hypothetical protein
MMLGVHCTLSTYGAYFMLPSITNAFSLMSILTASVSLSGRDVVSNDMLAVH